MENQLRTPCFSINGNTLTWSTKTFFLALGKKKKKNWMSIIRENDKKVPMSGSWRFQYTEEKFSLCNPVNSSDKFTRYRISYFHIILKT